MEIKFWDNMGDDYDEFSNLAVTSDGGILLLVDTETYEDVSEYYEAHFFLNGERVNEY